MDECVATVASDDSTTVDPSCHTPLSLRATAFSIEAIMASRSQPERSDHWSVTKDPLSCFQDVGDDYVSETSSGNAHDNRENSGTDQVAMETDLECSPSANDDDLCVSASDFHHRCCHSRLPVGCSLTDSTSGVLDGVQCLLEPRELWKRFHELGTEMIITKSGRRMFPTLRVSFSGLCPDLRYSVALDIVPVDRKRYRYAYHRSSWVVAGKSDPPKPCRLYYHPESPFTAEQLTKQTVSFERLKLTNNPVDRPGHIVLNSMHRYQPRIYVIVTSSTSPCELDKTSIDLMNPKAFKAFVFPETIFTAVTAYQNQLITRLKIDSNPFAKGFRDSVRLTELEGKEGLSELQSPVTSAESLYLNSVSSKFHHRQLPRSRSVHQSTKSVHVSSPGFVFKDHDDTVIGHRGTLKKDEDYTSDQLADVTGSTGSLLLELSNYLPSTYSLLSSRPLPPLQANSPPADLQPMRPVASRHFVGIQKVLSAFSSLRSPAIQNAITTFPISGYPVTSGSIGFVDNRLLQEAELKLNSSISYEAFRFFPKTIGH